MSLVVHLMGTVRLVRDGQPVDVGGPKQQAVLAVLALSAGRRVSTDRLVDLVWDESPPASARRTVQSYLASLRRALGDDAPLEPSQNGYTLNVDRGQVDLLVFEDQAADLLGDVGLDPDDKAQGLADVLSTWETPLDGLRGASRLADLAAPFEELRLQAFEGLATAQIAGTRAGDAVKMLEALVREHPTRENLWLELASGLNSLGRRDAALNAIQRAREALREHLGVHPSALLAALETDLLTGHAERRPHSDGNGAEPGSDIHPARSDDVFELPNVPAPYRGLFRFEATDSAMFFGRDDDTALLIDMVGASSFVAVVGASGSGKSSLVRAGLIPALAQLGSQGAGEWVAMACIPGADPFRSLAEQVVRLAPPGVALLDEVDRLAERFATRDDGLITALRAYSAGDVGPVLLVVDQFEELFTLSDASGQRSAQAARFVANLAVAAANADETVKIVVTLRADFVAPALSVDGLADLLQGNQLMLGALTGTKLHDAIVRPAEQVGALFEKGLVSTIIGDVDNEPGALPLLQHALYELWTRRHGSWLTLDAYHASGGVIGALSTTAETVYQSFSPAQQEITRQVFIRLTTLGEGVPDTRRRAKRTELYPMGINREDVDAVLGALSGQNARLIVVEEDSVEVAHEAVLRNWGTLRAWLDGNREALRVHRRLGQAADEWANDHHRDAASLYRGARLAEAVEYAGADPTELNHAETEFLAASTTQANDELEVERQRSRALRRRLIAATAAFVLAVAGVIIAVVFLIQARSAESHARLAEQAADELAVEATARSLAASSEQVLARSPDLAALLALEADRTRSTPVTSRAMLNVVTSPWERTLTTAFVNAVAFSPDGTQIVTAGGNGAVMWDIDGTQQTTLTTARVDAVAFSPDGTHIVTAGGNGAVVWDLDGTQQTTLTTAFVNAVAFSPDGTQIVTASDDGAVMWDLDGTQQTTLTTTAFVNAVAFSPDGTQIVTGGVDGAVVWDLDGTERTTLTTAFVNAVAFSPDGTQIVTGGGNGAVAFGPGGTQQTILTSAFVNAVAFSPDGTHIVTASDDGAVVWDLDGTQQTTLTTTVVGSVAFSPDGTHIVTSGGDDGAVVWDLDGTQQTTLTTARAFSVAFSPDGTQIVTAGDDGAVVWDLDGTQQTTLTTAFVFSVTFSPDGTRIVTTGGDDGAVVWDLDGTQQATLTTAFINAVAFSPDGTQIVTASDAGVRVWDLDGTQQTTLTTAVVGSVAFSPDGTQIVTTGVDGAVMWDLDGTEQATLTTARVFSVAFSPDGTDIVTGGDDGVRVWDLDGTEQATLANAFVFSVAFSPDGTQIVTAGVDGAVVFRTWKESAMRDELERRLGPRAFDLSECAAYGIDPCTTGD